jgi:predicted ester cyclase
MSEQENEAIVRRFYEELWNNWRLELADELVATAVSFRSSLGQTATSLAECKEYEERLRLAFPDWHNQNDELIAVRDWVVVRLTWTGTHRGPLGGVAPTGKPVTCAGAAFFRFAEGKITEAWVVGDTQEPWRTLGCLSV